MQIVYCKIDMLHLVVLSLLLALNINAYQAIDVQQNEMADNSQIVDANLKKNNSATSATSPLSEYNFKCNFIYGREKRNCSSIVNTIRQNATIRWQRIRNNKFWLDRYGVPEIIQPSAWCSDKAMVVAIPTDVKNYAEVKQFLNITKYPNSKCTCYEFPNAEKMWSWSNRTTKLRQLYRLNSNRSYKTKKCRAQIVTDFFRTKSGKIDSWLAYAEYGQCGAKASVSTAKYDYHTNIFRPAPPNRAINYKNSGVVVTCACPRKKSIKNQKKCIPTVRWEKLSGAIDVKLSQKNMTGSKNNQYIKKKFHVTDDLLKLVARNQAGGSILSAQATVGKANNITISIATDDRILVESHVYGSPYYLWPRHCVAICKDLIKDQTCVYQLVVHGCPVSKNLDFIVHEPKSKSKKVDKGKLIPGIIHFSFKVFGLEKDINSSGYADAMIIRCHMDQLEHPATVEDMCNKKLTNLHLQENYKTRKSLFELPLHNKMATNIVRKCESNKDVRELPQFNEKLVDTVIPNSAIHLFVKKNRYLQTIKSKSKRQHQYNSSPINQISDWTSVFTSEPVIKAHFAVTNSKWNQYFRAKKEAEKIAEVYNQMDIRQQKLYETMDELLKSSMNNVTQNFSFNTSSNSHDLINSSLNETVLVLDGQSPLAASAVIETTAGVGTVADSVVPTTRYRPVANLFVQEFFNEIVYGPWVIQYGRDFIERKTEVQVGNKLGFVGSSANLELKEIAVNTGWRDVVASVSYDELQQQVGVSLSKGPYGVNIGRANVGRATAVEVVSRGIEVATIVDFLDRTVGQRIKVRSFEINLKHDFDDIIVPGDVSVASEIFVEYRTVSISLGVDIRDTSYAVSIGLRGYSVSILRNFISRATDFQANWGNGWRLVLGGDFIDPFSSEIFSRVGFGKIGRAYVEAGAGIGDDGIPQATVEFESADVGFAIEFLDDVSDRVLLYSLSVGKFSYVWESVVVPANLRIPVILGIDPFIISDFLIPTDLITDDFITLF